MIILFTLISEIVELRNFELLSSELLLNKGDLGQWLKNFTAYNFFSANCVQNLQFVFGSIYNEVTHAGHYRETI